MTDKSATERLRELLDERGVEWADQFGPFPVTAYKTHYVVWIAKEYTDGLLSIETRPVTPEQAIAATLGGGECKLHECEGSFSATNRPVWRCDCGAFMTQYTDATTYHKPRFCPNCGRKVKR